ncbi:RNA methyltransferase [bacterium]|nr:RNA methyltransferase [bacterium]
MKKSCSLPIVVLVRPQIAENIGATARAMVNFGITELRLVTPRTYDEAHAARMACDGRTILKNLQIFPDLRTALEDCAYTIATTRRARRVKISSLQPEEAVSRLCRIEHSEKTAIIFGAEAAGLTNEEVFLCDTTSTIPTGELGSLNLGQAVIIYLYEWFRKSPAILPEKNPLDRLATHGEKQRVYDLLNQLLITSDYQPRGRLPEFIRRVKLLFEDRLLTFREQKIFLKVLRYLEKRDT